MSSIEADKTIPVTPPIVKRNIKPIIHQTIISPSMSRDVPNMYNQEKTFIPVGTPIIIVTELKNTAVFTSSPIMNM